MPRRWSGPRLRWSRAAPCSRMPTPFACLQAARAVRAENILIATGAAPHPGGDIAGLEHVISSNEAFHLEELPKRILIQGGGYIAVEFAGIFNGLGSEVTLVYRGDNILRGFDDDVREHLRSEMERRGITIVTRQTVDAVEKVEHGLCVESVRPQVLHCRSRHVRHRTAAEYRRPRSGGSGRPSRQERRHCGGRILAHLACRTSMPSATSPIA